jgi:hypothetical protein
MMNKIANAAKSAAAWGTTSTSKKTVDGVHVHHHGGKPTGKPEGKEKPTFQKDELQLSKKQPAGGYGCKLEKNDGAENEKGAAKPSLKDELESKYGKLFQPMMGDAKPVGKEEGKQPGFELEGKPGLKDGGNEDKKLEANHKAEGKFDFNPDAADEAGDD